MANDNTFLTERLPLATFLHASGRLRFLGCEPSSTDRVGFLFDDPDSSGPEAELEYERGAPVAATALFASQKFLRRQMTGQLDDNRKTGATKHASSR